jgi:hypothetical protein
MPQTHLFAMVYTKRSWVVYIGRLRVAHIERLWVAHIERLRVAHIERLWVAYIERLRVAHIERLRVAHTMRSRMDHYNPVNDTGLRFPHTRGGEPFPTEKHSTRPPFSPHAWG